MIKFEEATGHNSERGKGHRFVDVTNIPSPSILQSRPFKVEITPPIKL